MNGMQSASDFSVVRERWNGRYRAGEHTWTDPDPLLLHLYEEFIAPLFPQDGPGPRRGLDLAGGAGRHAIWMAKQGWQMTLADLSDEATTLARQNAQAAGVELQTVCEPDIDTLTRASASPGGQYDLIMVFQYLDRSLFPAMRTAIRPGGLILYKTHTMDHLEIGDGKGPKDPERLLRRQELLRVFAGARVLSYNETVVRRGTQCLLAQMS
jgi:2-polyprenyl-3-methyl-5-hydroxy-6-metoxy-1,4-benzoquinol methylase